MPVMIVRRIWSGVIVLLCWLLDWLPESLEVAGDPCILEVFCVSTDVDVLLVEWHKREEELLRCAGGVTIGLETFKLVLVCVL